MTIDAPPVEGKDVKAGDRLMSNNQVQVTLLTQLVAARPQELGVVGAVGRMAGETVLLHRRMLPKEWTASLCMALIAEPVGRVGHQHFAAFSSMRVVAGGATHLHVVAFRAEQMSGALKQCFPFFIVAAQAGVFYRLPCQHPLWRLRVMHAVTRQATHVASVVLPGVPIITPEIPGVTRQTGFVRLGRREFCGINCICGCQTYPMLVAVAMARLARHSALCDQGILGFAVDV